MDRATQALRIEMLGGFRVRVGSRIVEERGWRLKKAAALVKLLALSPWHRLHREQAVEYLWPDLGKKAAANNLRQALHAARRTLVPDPAAGSSYLSSVGESLVLCPEVDLWIDVEAFEEAAATARHSGEPATYQAAIDLYAGDLLPNDRYEDWPENRRQELRQAFLALLTELSGSYERHGERERAIATLQRATSEEPTLEEAHVRLMRLHALSGESTEAIKQYERLEEVLSRELGSQPAASSRALRKKIEGGGFPPSPQQGSSDAPAARTSGADMHNLPASRTSFVGKEREMLEVKRALAMTRLLTLTGAGGSGKTRLAIETARDLIGAYPDGVWLVELAGFSEPGLVPQAVAVALGVEEQPGQPLPLTLTQALRTRRTLLVIDNCEHLVEAVARLVDTLLDACPQVRVLATSREALRVVGEANWPVSLLSLPDAGRRPTVEDLERCESTRLFAERARHRNPAFALSPQNAGAVAEICRRLDGIPLAIELAVARVGLSVEEIASRLGDSLGLLTTGGRTAVARQRTLRGALDWSHELLSENEKKLFRRLAVFAGGWTLAAAEFVGAGDGLEGSDLFEVLSQLVDKSLVLAEAPGDGTLRYTMLEPIRQYALEKLEDSGEAENVRRLHATFFRTLAEEAEPKLWGAEEAAWLNRLEPEHDNVRAALTWALGGGDVGLGLCLAGAIGWFWRVRGHVGEGTRWLEEALARADDATKPAARAAALFMLGYFYNHQNDFDRAEIYLSEAVAFSRGIGDPFRLSEALVTLAWLATKRGDYARATTLYEESLATARESGELRSVAGSLVGLGWIAASRGDFERARRLWEENLTINREIGNISGIAVTFINMGFVEVVLGNFDRATVLLEEGLTLGRELGNRGMIGDCLFVLGLAETLGGDPKRAYKLLIEALAITAEREVDRDTAENLEGLAVAAGALGQHARAARLWGAADVFRDTHDQPWFPVERMVYEPQLDTARSQTDDPIWESSFAEGKAMTLEQAVEYTLSKDGPIASETFKLERHPEEQSPALTRREQGVAALVAQGLTNRRIASQLFISERTVDHHVSSILKKLGLTSRGQVASHLRGK